MTASLVEMVLAIAITGIIFVSAIVPTTQIMIAYQEAEAGVRGATAHAMAGVRVEQTAAAIWRDDDPPENHAKLAGLGNRLLEVGAWRLELRSRTDEIGQQHSGGWASPWTPLTGSVQTRSGFTGMNRFLLNDGSWGPSGAADDVLAVQWGWADPGNGRQYGGLMVAPDRQFSAGLIELPQPETSVKYDRDDYERTMTLSLGSWP